MIKSLVPFSGYNEKFYPDRLSPYWFLGIVLTEVGFGGKQTEHIEVLHLLSVWRLLWEILRDFSYVWFGSIRMFSGGLHLYNDVLNVFWRPWSEDITQLRIWSTTNTRSFSGTCEFDRLWLNNEYSFLSQSEELGVYK